MSDNLRNEITEMQRQLENKQRQLSNIETNCKHSFGEPIYDPEKVQEPVFSHYEPCGSDPIPIYNYYEKDKKRWMRKCSNCGKIEYTYKLKQVDKYYPDFG